VSCAPLHPRLALNSNPSWRLRMVGSARAIRPPQHGVEEVPQLTWRWQTLPCRAPNNPRPVELRVQGMPLLNHATARGNLYIQYFIAFPKELSETQKQVVRKTFPAA
jgi:hypothetical protein